MKKKLIIARIGDHQTIKFATDELAHYLKAIDPFVEIERRVYSKYNESVQGVLWVGRNCLAETSQDDEIWIDVHGGSGCIYGVNERSVLIAVYRFLYELGCRWIRPGAEGEIIKSRELDAQTLNVVVREKASYRHRGMYIEGSNRYEDVFNIIDWLPKVGMNGYIMQFFVPYCFFTKRYSGEYSFEEESNIQLSTEDVKHLVKSLEEEIAKRGLFYQAPGHGWTCEPLGIIGDGWYVDTQSITPEIKQYFAQINGTRELFGGVALNTNLCYSNPEVRKKMVSSVIKYCTENPNVDYVQFWLADGMNNFCECENCQKMRPSDWFVLLLNELDEKLTEMGIETKVVFDVYVDLLWAPEYYSIENPDRFVLLFAPISRSYSKAYTDCDLYRQVELPPYERNKLTMPKDVAANVAHLNSWKNAYSGECCLCDYHLMWDHTFDPGYYDCARVLHKDVTNLDKIGMNGMMSCQVQKTAFPTALPMYVMARGLWDKTSDFEAIADEYFATDFGADGAVVKEYFKTISALFHPPYIRKEMGRKNESVVPDLEKIPSVVDAFVAKYLGNEIQNGVYTGKSAAWRYLYIHAEYCKLLADLLKHRAMGDEAEDAQRLEKIRDFLQSIQKETQNVLDVQNHWHCISLYL